MPLNFRPFIFRKGTRMINQCSDCGGFCKKSGCERENVKPTPKLKPLSDEQIGEIGRKYEKFDNQGNEFFARWGFARAIEAAHGIKE